MWTHFFLVVSLMITLLVWHFFWSPIGGDLFQILLHLCLYGVFFFCDSNRRGFEQPFSKEVGGAKRVGALGGVTSNTCHPYADPNFGNLFINLFWEKIFRVCKFLRNFLFMKKCFQFYAIDISLELKALGLLLDFDESSCPRYRSRQNVRVAKDFCPNFQNFCVANSYKKIMATFSWRPRFCKIQTFLGNVYFDH